MDGKLGVPVFKELLKELAINVAHGQDATTFSNIYLEILRDESGRWDGEMVDTFSVLLDGKEWPEVLVKLAPYMDPETEAVLNRQEAQGFYKDFHSMVSQVIREGGGGDVDAGEEWNRG